LHYGAVICRRADVLPVVAGSVIEYSSITDILISSLAIALL
jgi:hypothetical protein